MTSARRLIADMLDPGSYESWDEPVDVSGHDSGYQEQLRKAATRAGTDEAVITGRGSVRGRPVVVLVSEFGFLAGSIGRAAAARITSAVRRATAERLPVLASTASGGTRMQEGAPAFVEMIRISAALMDHKAAGLPYLVYLRHPTTGGVFASWGSLGQVTVAEPGALIGFLGPKVHEKLHGHSFPEIQRAEHLAAHGVIDGVVRTEDLPHLLDRTLAVLVDPPAPAERTGAPAGCESEGTTAESGSAGTGAASVGERVDGWTAVQRTREPDRLGVREVLRYGASDTVRLTEPDASLLVALTRLAGQTGAEGRGRSSTQPCVVVAQDRSQDKPLGPAALRQAQRGMRLAQDLRLPLVTMIDTPGAELSAAAEEGGLAGEIARCIATMTTLTVPTLALLLGQGTGGGALALLPATTVVAMEYAWLAPLPPEGASIIVHGDTTHAAALANAQRITATDLLRTGTVHHLIAEPPDTSPEQLARTIAATCASNLRNATPPSGS